jgi:hypothetical protein
MNKKLLILLAIFTTFNQIAPRWGWGGGYWGGGPYWGGYYGSPYYGYNNGAAVAVGAIGTAATIAAIESNRPKSDAEVEYQNDKDRRRAINKQISDVRKEIKSTNRNKDLSPSEREQQIKLLNQQISDLQKDLAHG